MTKAAPELAAAVQRCFDAHIHKTLATLRTDGSPRVSGQEMSFRDGNVWLGMMPDSRKARDLQRDEMEARLGPAKGKDSATSLGPWIVTTDELAPYIHDGRVHVRCILKVNDVLWMDNNGGLMYHTWGAMIERASRDSRIVPGDVLGGGTVTGGSIGEAIRNGFPARYLQPGDVVEIEVEGIGVLRNTLAPKVAPDPNYRFKAPPLASPASAR